MEAAKVEWRAVRGAEVKEEGEETKLPPVGMTMVDEFKGEETVETEMRGERLGLLVLFPRCESSLGEAGGEEEGVEEREK